MDLDFAEVPDNHSLNSKTEIPVSRWPKLIGWKELEKDLKQIFIERGKVKKEEFSMRGDYMKGETYRLEGMQTHKVVQFI